MSYRRDIDGLRAIAIILVVLCHSGLIFRGGFMGVDVFFVISGYLITTLVSREIQEGRFSLARFWMRRAYRLLPALTVASLVTVTLGCLVLLPEELAELGRALMAQSVLLANVFFWQTSGYFDGVSEQKPLIHFWSLAVEEQFYLVFPLLLLLRPRKGLLVLGLASFVLTVGSNATRPEACFYLLPYRAWELLLGGALSTFGWEVPPRWQGLASWAGLLGILAGSLLINDQKFLWPSWATLVPCLSTCLLIASCRTPTTPVARFLAHPRMVHLGLLSYSWYLWHWPMIAFWNSWKLARTPVAVRILWVLLGYALARLSYRYVETPYRKPRQGWTPARVLLLALAVQMMLFAVGLALNASQGWPRRFPDSFLRLAHRGEPPWANYQVSMEQVKAGEFPTLGKEGPVRLFLWGDSHAMAIIPELEKLALESGCRVKVATQSGVVPLLDYPAPDVCSLGSAMPEWNQQVMGQILKQNPPPRVLLASRWSYQPRAELQACLSKTSQALRGREVYLLGEVPVYPYDPRKALLRARLFGQPTSEVGLRREVFAAQNANIYSLVPPEVRTLDPTSLLFADRRRAQVEMDGLSCYWDDNHLSPQGARLLSPLLRPLFGR